MHSLFYLKKLLTGQNAFWHFHVHLQTLNSWTLCLCSWPLRKVVLVLRRSAARASQNWRRRLKLSTSSESKKKPPLLAKRMLNLRNPCACFFYLSLLIWLSWYLFCCQYILFILFSAPSLRLAYKDLEQQRKISEQKLKGLDGKKKEQAERLGMGLGIRRYDDVEETSPPVVDLWIFFFFNPYSVFLQWSVSLCDIRHAHHPAGESMGGQSHQRKTTCWGGWWWRVLQF